MQEKWNKILRILIFGHVWGELKTLITDISSTASNTDRCDSVSQMDVSQGLGWQDTQLYWLLQIFLSDRNESCMQRHAYPSLLFLVRKILDNKSHDLFSFFVCFPNPGWILWLRPKFSPIVERVVFGTWLLQINWLLDPKVMKTEYVFDSDKILHAAEVECDL